MVCVYIYIYIYIHMYTYIVYMNTFAMSSRSVAHRKPWGSGECIRTAI